MTSPSSRCCRGLLLLLPAGLCRLVGPAGGFLQQAHVQTHPCKSCTWLVSLLLSSCYTVSAAHHKHHVARCQQVGQRATASAQPWHRQPNSSRKCFKQSKQNVSMEQKNSRCRLPPVVLMLVHPACWRRCCGCLLGSTCAGLHVGFVKEFFSSK